MVASIAFPYALYLHHNNLNIERPTPQFVNDIRFSIDTCEFVDGNILIKGWAFPAKGQAGKITRLFVDVGDNVYALYKKTTKTDEVKRLFSGRKQYGMAGFHASKHINTTPSKINLIISIEDADGKVHESKHNCQ